jgi:hypothetical protein
MISLVERSPQLYARIAGMLYLAIIVLGIFGEMFVRGSLVATGDSAATVNNIAASPFLWRVGIAGDLLMHVLDVPQIVIFYFLLRPVDESLAMLAAVFNLIQTAVLALNKLNLLVPLFLLEDATHTGAFPLHELQAISHLAIKAHGHGFAIGLLFFGFACLVLGYLLFKSGYFPRTLGVLLQLAGASYLINSFALLLAPSFAQTLFPGILIPALVGEVSLCVWLIAKGVNVQRWEQRVKS